jgi:hypothetical protein
MTKSFCSSFRKNTHSLFSTCLPYSQTTRFIHPSQQFPAGIKFFTTQMAVLSWDRTRVGNIFHSPLHS